MKSSDSKETKQNELTLMTKLWKNQVLFFKDARYHTTYDDPSVAKCILFIVISKLSGKYKLQNLYLFCYA